MRTYAIFGSWWGGNLGDVAILCGTIETIQSQTPDAEILIPSSQPARLREHLPDYADIEIYPSTTNYWGQNTIKCIRNADRVIIGGGGLIFSDGMFNPLKNHLINITPLVYVSNFLNTDTHLISVGVSTLEGRAAPHLLEKVLDKVREVSVRDQRSKRILEDIGEIDIGIVPDMAFSLYPTTDEDLPLDLPEDYVIVSFHSNITMNCSLDARNTAREIIQVVDGLCENSDSELVFYNNYTKYDWLENLVSDVDISSDHRVIGNECKLTPHQAITIFSGANRAICSQMHGNIMATLGGTPTTAIEYDPKVRAMMGFLGQESRVLTPEEARSEAKLSKVFETHSIVPINQREQLKRTIEQQLSDQIF